MGIVLAKSKEQIPEGLFDDPESFMESVTRQNAMKFENNPGTFDELHKLCKDVLPSAFEGGKVIMNKMLSNNFQISHTLSLSCINNSTGYKFGTTFVGSKHVSPSECFPVLFGDIDPQGNLNANMVHQFTDKIRCKMTALIQNKKVAGAQVTADYRAEDYTFSMTICNPNIINPSGMMLAHFLQNICPGVALGAELAYQCGPQMPGGETTALTAAGRVDNGSVCVSGTLAQSGVHLCFYRRASDQLQISAEFESNFKSREAVTIIGYQVDLPKADVVFKGSLDSNWNVCAVLETKLPPLPVSFAMSGLLNHKKNQFRLGCGIVIG